MGGYGYSKYPEYRPENSNYNIPNINELYHSNLGKIKKDSIFAPSGEQKLDLDKIELLPDLFSPTTNAEDIFNIIETENPNTSLDVNIISNLMMGDNPGVDIKVDDFLEIISAQKTLVNDDISNTLDADNMINYLIARDLGDWYEQAILRERAESDVLGEVSFRLEQIIANDDEKLLSFPEEFVKDYISGDLRQLFIDNYVEYNGNIVDFLQEFAAETVLPGSPGEAVLSAAISSIPIAAVLKPVGEISQQALVNGVDIMGNVINKIDDVTGVKQALEKLGDRIDEILLRAPKTSEFGNLKFSKEQYNLIKGLKNDMDGSSAISEFNIRIHRDGPDKAIEWALENGYAIK